MRRERAAETAGRSTREERKPKPRAWSRREWVWVAAASRRKLERSAGGRRRSRRTTRSGGAQTRSREASMETRKKAVLAQRQGRAHRASPPCTSCSGSFFSMRTDRLGHLAGAYGERARSNPEDGY
jgi:hypothetical protein